MDLGTRWDGAAAASEPPGVDRSDRKLGSAMHMAAELQSRMAVAASLRSGLFEGPQVLPPRIAK
jgi:hypothetical protein